MQLQNMEAADGWLLSIRAATDPGKTVQIKSMVLATYSPLSPHLFFTHGVLFQGILFQVRYLILSITHS